MGLWVQNVGVASAGLPGEIAALADSERFWLPEPGAGDWTWMSLRDMHPLEELDRLVVTTAREAAAPAIGYSVHDEDDVYVVAAAPDGGDCRLILWPDSFDAGDHGTSAAELAPDGPERFAAWSAGWAPKPIDARSVAEHCETGDVIALLEAVGAYPEREPDTSPAWERWYPDDMESAGATSWDGGGHSRLVGPRRYSILREPAGDFEGPPGPWAVLLARDQIDFTAPFMSPGPAAIRAYLTVAADDVVFGLNGWFENIEKAEQRFAAGYYGRTPGPWRDVPDDVGRSLADSIAWVLSQAGC